MRAALGTTLCARPAAAQRRRPSRLNILSRRANKCSQRRLTQGPAGASRQASRQGRVTAGVAVERRRQAVAPHPRFPRASAALPAGFSAAGPSPSRSETLPRAVRLRNGRRRRVAREMAGGGALRGPSGEAPGPEPPPGTWPGKTGSGPQPLAATPPAATGLAVPLSPTVSCRSPPGRSEAIPSRNGSVELPCWQRRELVRGTRLLARRASGGLQGSGRRRAAAVQGKARMRCHGAAPPDASLRPPRLTAAPAAADCCRCAHCVVSLVTATDPSAHCAAAGRRLLRRRLPVI